MNTDYFDKSKYWISCNHRNVPVAIFYSGSPGQVMCFYLIDVLWFKQRAATVPPVYLPAARRHSILF